MTEVVTTAAGPVSVERAGDGPDLVLLHSLLSDRHVFDTIVPTLAERRRVTLVDLPGFGATIPVERGMDRYAAVIAALLEAGGYEPSTTALMGNGLGAFVALATAVLHGDAFDRMVLAGCGAWFPPEGKTGLSAMIERVDAGGTEAILDVAALRMFSDDYLRAHPEVRIERHQVLRKTGREAFLTACRSLLDLDLRSQAGAVTTPTLVVSGSDDAATPASMGRDLAARLPRARHVELPGVAHAPQLQDPATFLAAIGEFLGLA